jgi:hypothetical protein
LLASARSGRRASSRSAYMLARMVVGVNERHVGAGGVNLRRRRAAHDKANAGLAGSRARAGEPGCL